MTCDLTYPCSVCNLKKGNTFTLRGKVPKNGLGEEEETFDRRFYVHGVRNGSPHFRPVSLFLILN